MRRAEARERFERQLGELHEMVARQCEMPAPSEPEQWLDSITTRKVLFHLKDGSSVEGFLAGNYADGIVLTSPAVRIPEGKATQLAGDVFVPRSNILLAQLDT